MARYEKVEGVCLDLTPHQAAVLKYVMERAREDSTFFDFMVGSSTRNVTTVFRAALGQIRDKLQVANATTGEHRPRSA